MAEKTHVLQNCVARVFASGRCVTILFSVACRDVLVCGEFFFSRAHMDTTTVTQRYCGPKQKVLDTSYILHRGRAGFANDVGYSCIFSYGKRSRTLWISVVRSAKRSDASLSVESEPSLRRRTVEPRVADVSQNACFSSSLRV